MFGNNKYKKQLDVMTVVAMSFALQREGTPEGLAGLIAINSYERELTQEEKQQYHQFYMTIEGHAKKLARKEMIPSIAGQISET